MADEDKNSELELVRNSKIFQSREQASATVQRDSNEDFKRFRSTFLSSIDMLKQQMMTVYTDAKIDQEKLYGLASGLFSNMQHTVDGFLYLNAIYSSEYYIVEHCLRVGLLAHLFAKWLDYDFDSIREATVAGFLHDIGMLQVPKSIIEKQGALTPSELSLMREHPARGALMLINKGASSDVVEATRSHHERYDGSGYPKKKKGDQINRLAALIGIVDTYDSMTSNRPYSVAKCPFDVMIIFERQMRDKFEPGLLYKFIETIPYMYKNVLVELSDGQKARVVFVNTHAKTSPIVQRESDGAFIDLSMNRTLKIARLL